MYITNTLVENCAFKNDHTNQEWVVFKSGTAQVKKEIGEQLVETYDYIEPRD